MTWIAYAAISAGAAALTAVLAKIGVEGVPSNLATAIRTVVVLVFAWAIALGLGEHRALGTLSRRSLVFLALSALATGISWLAYYRALQMAPPTRRVYRLRHHVMGNRLAAPGHGVAGAALVRRVR